MRAFLSAPTWITWELLSDPSRAMADDRKNFMFKRMKARILCPNRHLKNRAIALLTLHTWGAQDFDVDYFLDRGVDLQGVHYVLVVWQPIWLEVTNPCIHMFDLIPHIDAQFVQKNLISQAEKEQLRKWRQVLGCVCVKRNYFNYNLFIFFTTVAKYLPSANVESYTKLRGRFYDDWNMVIQKVKVKKQNSPQIEEVFDEVQSETSQAAEGDKQVLNVIQVKEPKLKDGSKAVDAKASGLVQKLRIKIVKKDAGKMKQKRLENSADDNCGNDEVKARIEKSAHGKSGKGLIDQKPKTATKHLAKVAESKHKEEKKIKIKIKKVHENKENDNKWNCSSNLDDEEKSNRDDNALVNDDAVDNSADNAADNAENDSLENGNASDSQEEDDDGLDSSADYCYESAPKAPKVSWGSEESELSEDESSDLPPTPQAADAYVASIYPPISTPVPSASQSSSEQSIAMPAVTPPTAAQPSSTLGNTQTGHSISTGQKSPATNSTSVSSVIPEHSSSGNSLQVANSNSQQQLSTGVELQQHINSKPSWELELDDLMAKNNLSAYDAFSMLLKDFDENQLLLSNLAAFSDSAEHFNCDSSNNFAVVESTNQQQQQQQKQIMQSLQQGQPISAFQQSECAISTTREVQGGTVRINEKVIRQREIQFTSNNGSNGSNRIGFTNTTLQPSSTLTIEEIPMTETADTLRVATSKIVTPSSSSYNFEPISPANTFENVAQSKSAQQSPASASSLGVVNPPPSFLISDSLAPSSTTTSSHSQVTTDLPFSLSDELDQIALMEFGDSFNSNSTTSSSDSFNPYLPSSSSIASLSTFSPPSRTTSTCTMPLPTSSFSASSSLVPFKSNNISNNKPNCYTIFQSKNKSNCYHPYQKQNSQNSQNNQNNQTVVAVENKHRYSQPKQQQQQQLQSYHHQNTLPTNQIGHSHQTQLQSYQAAHSQVSQKAPLAQQFSIQQSSFSSLECGQQNMPVTKYSQQSLQMVAKPRQQVQQIKRYQYENNHYQSRPQAQPQQQQLQRYQKNQHQQFTPEVQFQPQQQQSLEQFFKEPSSSTALQSYNSADNQICTYQQSSQQAATYLFPSQEAVSNQQQPASDHQAVSSNFRQPSNFNPNQLQPSSSSSSSSSTMTTIYNDYSPPPQNMIQSCYRQSSTSINHHGHQIVSHQSVTYSQTCQQLERQVTVHRQKMTRMQAKMAQASAQSGGQGLDERTARQYQQCLDQMASELRRLERCQQDQQTAQKDWQSKHEEMQAQIVQQQEQARAKQAAIVAEQVRLRAEQEALKQGQEAIFTFQNVSPELLTIQQPYQQAKSFEQKSSAYMAQGPKMQQQQQYQQHHHHQQPHQQQQFQHQQQQHQQQHQHQQLQPQLQQLNQQYQQYQQPQPQHQHKLQQPQQLEWTRNAMVSPQQQQQQQVFYNQAPMAGFVETPLSNPVTTHLGTPLSNSAANSIALPLPDLSSSFIENYAATPAANPFSSNPLSAKSSSAPSPLNLDLSEDSLESFLNSLNTPCKSTELDLLSLGDIDFINMC